MSTFKLIPKYYFGHDALNNFKQEIVSGKYQHPLILYGGGSIKRNGVYDSICQQLTSLNLKWAEFSGIEPNPRDTTIYKAAQLCREQHIDIIIAAGGGSVIDASKVIATVATNHNIQNVWDYVSKKIKAEHQPLPIFSVITLAGTASENNGGSVVTNLALGRKQGIINPAATPIVAFENSVYTNTLSAWQMHSGIFDCLSHLLEQYYDQKIFLWSEEMILANIRTLIQATEMYKHNPANQVARDNILWTTSMSLNGMTAFNGSGGDWNVHTLEHALSAKWDVTHGAGLALLTPTYIQYRSAHDEWFKQKTLHLAKHLFGLTTVKAFVEYLNKFIKQLDLPLKWLDFKEITNISEADLKWLAQHASENSSGLSYQQYLEILQAVKTH